MFINRFSFAAPQVLRRELDNLFDNVFELGERLPFGRPHGYPAINIWEDGDRLYAEAEVPGLSMDELDVQVVGNELTIKGSRKPEGGEKASYHRQERGTGEFARSITLPIEVNADRVEATLKDGMLTIVLPKAEAAKPRKIAVKSS